MRWLHGRHRHQEHDESPREEYSGLQSRLLPADIGIQALSGAAERNEDILYVMYDNEAYMNTGIQRSGCTPKGAWTTTTPIGKVKAGKTEHKKDMPMIMLAP